MFRLSLALTAILFISTMVSGIMAAGQKGSLWQRMFWISMILFLSSSSFSLSVVAPLWLALAPMIPALLIAMILLRSGNMLPGSRPGTDPGSDHES